MKLIVLLIVVGATFGCQQITVSHLQGTHLKLEMSAPQQAVLFIVERDGEIRYGGGRDALVGKTSWTGHMDEAQQETFDALIASSHWLEQVVADKNHDGISYYSIRIRDGVTDHRFDLPISDPIGTSVFDMLSTVALARLDAHLQSLPKPNMDTIIDRGVKESANP